MGLLLSRLRKCLCLQRMTENNVFFEFLGNVQYRECLLDEVASMVSRKDKVLDIATGTGYLAKNVITRSKDLFCLDQNIIAINNIHNDGLNGIVGDANNFPFKSNTFNKVLSWSALVHIPLWRNVLKEAFRVTCLNGKVAILEPKGAYSIRAFRDFTCSHKPPHFKSIVDEFKNYCDPQVLDRGFATIISGEKKF